MPRSKSTQDKNSLIDSFNKNSNEYGHYLIVLLVAILLSFLSTKLVFSLLDFIGDSGFKFPAEMLTRKISVIFISTGGFLGSILPVLKNRLVIYLVFFTFLFFLFRIKPSWSLIIEALLTISGVEVFVFFAERFLYISSSSFLSDSGAELTPDIYSVVLSGGLGFIIFLTWRYFSKIPTKAIFTFFLLSVSLIFGGGIVFFNLNNVGSVISGFIAGWVWVLFAALSLNYIRNYHRNVILERKKKRIETLKRINEMSQNKKIH